MEAIKIVFGTMYSSISEVHFIALQKWLHINRRSASGFELLSRMNLEIGN
jgi:hypothetical protein